MSTPGITVIDVFKALGLEPSPKMTWSAGHLMRSRYQEIYGRLPPKELRPKTNGNGVHCFAIYPDGFRGEIEKCIAGLGVEKAAQPDLFGGGT